MRVACNSQHTYEWYAARRGKPTASSVWRIMKTMQVSRGDKKKGDNSADYENYLHELAREIRVHLTAEHYVSPEMDKGTEYEPEARRRYRELNDVAGERTGFVLHPTIDRFGCSPDLLIPELRKGAEFKCPLPSTHDGYLAAFMRASEVGLKGNDLAYAVIPNKYIYQVQASICICEYDSWDWCSFAAPHPEDGYDEFPEEEQMLQIPVIRDDKMIAEMEDKVIQFNAELLEYLNKIKASFHAPKLLRRTEL